ncbi:MAG: RodZ domain-containing protein [Bdellovibrionota bacterium]
MESFGRYLRAEREAREITIDDLSRVTKINRQILQAIEADDFQHLPPPVFVRGFVRSVCKAMGIPPEEMIRRFDDFQGTHGGEARPADAATPVAPIVHPDAPKVSASLGPLPFLVGLVILIGGIVAAYRLRPEPSRPQAAPSAPSLKSAAPEEPKPEAPAAVVVPAPEAAEAVKAEEGSAPSSESAAPSAAHTLVVTARETSWVQLTADGERPRDLMLERGKSLIQRFGERLTIRFGNGLNLAIEVDGERFERLSYGPNPGRVDLPLKEETRKKLLELAALPVPPPQPRPKPAPAAAPPSGTPSAPAVPPPAPPVPQGTQVISSPPAGGPAPASGDAERSNE